MINRNALSLSIANESLCSSCPTWLNSDVENQVGWIAIHRCTAGCQIVNVSLHATEPSRSRRIDSFKAAELGVGRGWGQSHSGAGLSTCTSQWFFSTNSRPLAFAMIQSRCDRARGYS